MTHKGAVDEWFKDNLAITVVVMRWTTDRIANWLQQGASIGEAHRRELKTKRAVVQWLGLCVHRQFGLIDVESSDTEEYDWT